MTTVYVHHYFKNSGIEVENFNPASALENAKAEIENRFKQAVTVGVNGDAAKARILLDEMLEGNLLGKPLGDMIKQTEQKNLTAARIPEGMEKSYASLGSKRSSSLMAQTFAEDLSKVITDTNNVIAELEDVLKTHYNDYFQSAIKTLANNSFSGSEDAIACRKIVQNALNKNIEWVELNNGDTGSGARLARDYVRLKQRVESLKILGDAKATGYTPQTRTEYSRQLIGKIGGTYTNIGGELGEIAIAKAIETSLEKIAKEIDGLHFDVNTVGSKRGFGATGKETKSAEFKEFLSEAKKQNKQSSFNKNDVTITVTDNDVTATFGLSVKVSGAGNKNANKVPNNIKIHDTTLNTILDKAQLKDSNKFNDYKKYNIAAGFGATEIKGMAVKGLQNMWSSYVKYAVLLNIVDYLAGDATLNNNSLFLVVNSKVYSMKDIVNGIVANPEYISIQGGLSRTPFSRINRNAWKGRKVDSARSKEEGEARSAEVITKLDSKFVSTSVKIKIALNSLISGGLSAL